MNKHFKKHLEASYARAFAECARTGHKVGDLDAIFNSIAMATFAELIVRECTTLLFNESERLYEYSTECDNMRESDEAEVVAEKCVDLITMIEEHFGVSE